MTSGRKLRIAFFLVIGSVVVKIGIGPAPFPESSPVDVHPTPPGGVIFITLDGVRERDLTSTWTTLRARIRRDGFFYGARADGEEMWISNTTARSLAGYRAIFTGLYQRFCWTNDCARSADPTLIDEMMDLGIPPKDAAIFASWKQIPLAIEARPRTVVSAEFEPIRNFPSSAPASLRAKLADLETAASRSKPEWEDCRKDEFTWTMAREYRRGMNPRFLYVSLVDSDEYGHANDFPSYQETLRRYERDILALIDEVESTPNGEHFSFVITTDHGRGSLTFKSHGWWIPGSGSIWAAILPSRRLREAGIHKRLGTRFRQVDFRPTLEYLLGLPLSPDRQGDSLVFLNSENDRSTRGH